QDRSWKQLGGDTTGKVALDSELSTGGFTGCLLHYVLSTHFVCICSLGIMAFYYTATSFGVDRYALWSRIRHTRSYSGIIPLCKIAYIPEFMPAVVNIMKENAALVTLIKPQFEARRFQVRNTNSYYKFCKKRRDSERSYCPSRALPVKLSNCSTKGLENSKSDLIV
ncbi:hypothetical protein V8G54_021688, partial [Vigna mungo]